MTTQGERRITVTNREPMFHPIEILDLGSIQVIAGMSGVEAKRQNWRAKADNGGELPGQSNDSANLLGPQEVFEL